MIPTARFGAALMLAITVSSCARPFVVPADRARSAAAPLEIPPQAASVVIPVDSGTVYLSSVVPAEFTLSSRGTTVIVNGVVVMRRDSRW